MLLNPFRTPKPLPILIPSNFVAKNGFPVVKAISEEPQKRNGDPLYCSMHRRGLSLPSARASLKHGTVTTATGATPHTASTTYGRFFPSAPRSFTGATRARSGEPALPNRRFYRGSILLYRRNHRRTGKEREARQIASPQTKKNIPQKWEVIKLLPGTHVLKIGLYVAFFSIIYTCLLHMACLRNNHSSVCFSAPPPN